MRKGVVFSTLSSSIIVFASKQETVGSSVGVLASDVTTLVVLVPTSQYVTEYWKTDHVRTFGQLLFIGPANSHTHTLPVHCCINGLS